MKSEIALEIPSVNSLDTFVDEFDAISFFKEPEGKYSFSIMKMYETPKDYELFDMGHKFFIMLHDGDETCDITEAILSDPVYMIKHYVKANYEGIIIKKSSRGKILLDKLMNRFTE